MCYATNSFKSRVRQSGSAPIKSWISSPIAYLFILIRCCFGSNTAMSQNHNMNHLVLKSLLSLCRCISWWLTQFIEFPRANLKLKLCPWFKKTLTSEDHNVTYTTNKWINKYAMAIIRRIIILTAECFRKCIIRQRQKILTASKWDLINEFDTQLSTEEI